LFFYSHSDSKKAKNGHLTLWMAPICQVCKIIWICYTCLTSTKSPLHASMLSCLPTFETEHRPKPIFGVDFTNILHEAFTCADPNSAKNTVKTFIFFTLLGSTFVKALHKMLLNLTLGRGYASMRWLSS